MTRIALAALLAILLLAIMAQSQRQPNDHEARLRDVERWIQTHDRDVPNSGVQVAQINANTARIARLEEAREADLHWFFAGVGTLLLATLAFLLKQTLFKNGKAAH